MITIDVTDEQTGHTYTATITSEERVYIDRNGARAGTGRVHQGRIVDCDAVIPEEVYAEIDDAVGPAILAAVKAVRPMIKALHAEASGAGDVAQVDLCERALSGDLAAIEACGRVIAGVNA